MDLPVYEMIINPEETSDVEVSFVALVDKPAIERNFMAFKDSRLNFAVNEEQRIISGPAMVADQLIYRKDENGEYNVFFSADTIKDIALKFFKKDYHKNLNLFHDPSLSLDGVTIFESFVSDKARGIQPMKGFDDLPDGTWFISAKVDNEQVWQQIKSGAVKGFSVEGIFSFMKKNSLNHTAANEYHLFERTFMADIKELWKAFTEKFLGELPVVPPVAPANPAPNQQLATDVTLKDGKVVQVDKMEVGGVVMIGEAPAPAGELELADGSKIVVGEGGVIMEIVAGGAPKMPPEAPDFSEQFKAYDEKLTAYESKFTEHINAFSAMSQEFAQTKDQLKQLVALVGQLIETPTAETVTGNKAGFNSHKVDTAEQKRKELAGIFAKLKNK